MNNTGRVEIETRLTIIAATEVSRFIFQGVRTWMNQVTMTTASGSTRKGFICRGITRPGNFVSSAGNIGNWRFREGADHQHHHLTDEKRKGKLEANAF